MSSRRRRRPAAAEEEHPDERWMASYMDMVTVLMCMFIVLFAMSTVDANKFDQLRNSLATGFGAVEIDRIDTAEGTVVPPELVDDEAEGFTPQQLALMEIEELTELKEKIDQALILKELDDAVQYKLDERGLTVRMIGSETFFSPDRAELTKETIGVLDVIGPVLAPVDYGVSVEGHTAQVRDLDPDPQDWELSAKRSVNVLRYLVEDGGVAMDRIAATGFGESRPMTTGGSAEDLAMNRRVDIVILSDAPETVRELIPGLVAGAEGKSA
jgi:chemotaxis protein MotB